MIVDVVLRLHMRERLQGEALETWLLAMERAIERMELCETAQVVGDARNLASRIASLLDEFALGQAR